MNISNDIRQI